MPNKLKEKMDRNEKVIGSFTHLGSGTVVECMGLSGLDFAVIDTEHAAFHIQDTLDYVRAAEVRGMSAVVRVQDHTRPSLHKALNCGADALIIPCMETMDEVRLLLEQGKFYPKGRHCFPYARNSSWGCESAGHLTEFFERENRETLLVPQCETVGFLNHIEEIMQLDGIDGVFIGPYDLSTDMGMPAQFDNPDFQKARARILKACKDAGKFAWIFSPSAEAAKKNLADGFDGTAVNMDTAVFINAYKTLVAGIRSY